MQLKPRQPKAGISIINTRQLRVECGCLLNTCGEIEHDEWEKNVNVFPKAGKNGTERRFDHHFWYWA